MKLVNESGADIANSNIDRARRVGSKNDKNKQLTWNPQHSDIAFCCL